MDRGSDKDFWESGLLNDVRAGEGSVPAGTAFLVSALMIYPAISAISVDLDKQLMQFDFQFVYGDRIDELVCRRFSEKLEKGLRFAQKLMRIEPIHSTWQYRNGDGIYAASWERDMETLTEREADTLHELLLDFYEENDLEFEEQTADSEQFYHFERVFDELFYRVQGMESPVRLRAYRDMGMIYIHHLPASMEPPSS